MKFRILLVLAIAFIASCTEQEDRNPALQSTINEDFFGALDARAIENDDGSFVIQGLTANENLTMFLESAQPGTYELGGTSQNFATFVDKDELVFFTNPFGEGRAIITDLDRVGQTLSGRFDFTAVVPGIDTLRVVNGVLFRVPFGFGVIQEPITDTDSDPATNAGSFAARVDEQSFTPFAVSAVSSDGSLTITGSGSMDAISITVPSDVQQGSFQITDQGFSASFRQGAVTEDAISGQIIIISNDTNTNNIRGTFSFMTENHSIALGQFNVIYQDF